MPHFSNGGLVNTYQSTSAPPPSSTFILGTSTRWSISWSASQIRTIRWWEHCMHLWGARVNPNSWYCADQNDVARLHWRLQARRLPQSTLTNLNESFCEQFQQLANWSMAGCKLFLFSFCCCRWRNPKQLNNQSSIIYTPYPYLSLLSLSYPFIFFFILVSMCACRWCVRSSTDIPRTPSFYARFVFTLVLNIPRDNICNLSFVSIKRR